MTEKPTTGNAPEPGLEPEPEAIDNAADKVEGQASVASLPLPDEVAARSADALKPTTDFVKVFVLGPGDYTAKSGFDHEPNKAAARQYAIDAGLWPTGDVKHVSTKTHEDGKSRVLTYRVPVGPAHRVAPESPNPEVVAEDGSTDGARNADASAIEDDGEQSDAAKA